MQRTPRVRMRRQPRRLQWRVSSRSFSHFRPPCGPCLGALPSPTTLNLTLDNSLGCPTNDYTEILLERLTILYHKILLVQLPVFSQAALLLVEGAHPLLPRATHLCRHLWVAVQG